MKTTKLMLVVLTAVCGLLTGCATRPPADNWRHLSWTPTSASMYVQNDYVIIEQGQAYELVFRPPLNPPTVIGSYATLEQAKQRAIQ